MAKASIKSKSGTTILIEGTDSEVARIVTLLEDRGGNETGLRRRRTPQPMMAKERENNAKFNATDGILRLREEGFFNKQKTLLDIKRALDEQGLIYPLTTLSGVVLKQVRKRNLRRIKEKKNWEYVKGSNI